MKKFLLAGVVGLIALWCTVALAKGRGPKVYRNWPDAEKVALRTGRLLVVAIVRRGNIKFMGGRSSIMSDKRLRKLVSYFVLVRVDAVKIGKGDHVTVANQKNATLWSKIVGNTGAILPVFAIATPDVTPIKVWDQADPAAVRRSIGKILKQAVKEHKPLGEKELKKAQSLIAQAKKEKREGKIEEAKKALQQVIKMNENCGLAKEAQDMIEDLEGRPKKRGDDDDDDLGITGDDDDDTGITIDEDFWEGKKKDTKKKDTKKTQPKKEKKKGPKLPGATAVISTEFGKIEIELFTKKAPSTCQHFIEMVKEGIYNDSTFGYVIPGKLVQCVPHPGRKVPDEEEPDFIDVEHEKGIVAFAHGSTPKMVGAPFYIAVDSLPERDGEYALFGKVKSGLAVVTAIAASRVISNKPKNPVRIRKIEIKF